MSAPPKLPSTSLTGQLMPYMSARHRQEVVGTVFEMLGGVERLHTESNRDAASYWKFMDMWAKGLPRATTTEHTVNSDSVEELLKRLDAGDSAQVINGSAEPIED